MRIIVNGATYHTEYLTKDAMVNILNITNFNTITIGGHEVSMDTLPVQLFSILNIDSNLLYNIAHTLMFKYMYSVGIISDDMDRLEDEISELEGPYLNLLYNLYLKIWYIIYSNKYLNKTTILPIDRLPKIFEFQNIFNGLNLRDSLRVVEEYDHERLYLNFIKNMIGHYFKASYSINSPYTMQYLMYVPLEELGDSSSHTIIRKLREGSLLVEKEINDVYDILNFYEEIYDKDIFKCLAKSIINVIMNGRIESYGYYIREYIHRVNHDVYREMILEVIDGIKEKTIPILLRTMMPITEEMTLSDIFTLVTLVLPANNTSYLMNSTLNHHKGREIFNTMYYLSNHVDELSPEYEKIFFNKYIHTLKSISGHIKNSFINRTIEVLKYGPIKSVDKTVRFFQALSKSSLGRNTIERLFRGSITLDYNKGGHLSCGSIPIDMFTKSELGLRSLFSEVILELKLS